MWAQAVKVYIIQSSSAACHEWVGTGPTAVCWLYNVGLSFFMPELVHTAGVAMASVLSEFRLHG